MADASMSVGVSADVEFTVGEKTKAWLVSLGWTPPAETPAAPVEATVEARAPYQDIETARQAMDARQAGFYQAQQMRNTLKAEVSSPERIDQMLVLAGVPLGRLDYAAEVVTPVEPEPAPVEDDSAIPLA